MKQIKIIKETSPTALEQGVNEALKTIQNGEAEIKYLLEQNTVVIEYIEKITQRMCLDCQFYDPSAGVAKAFGLCQRKGLRVRFTEHACDDFEDQRG